MLTRLVIRNFKTFDDVEIELGERVLFVGPNNSGKTTALQALALWDIGVKRWLEKRGSGKSAAKPKGITINRRDLLAIPVPAANLFWRNLHTRNIKRASGKTTTKNIRIEVQVDSLAWSCGMEFDYANAESFYCRPLRQKDGQYMEVPQEAKAARIAYLPPMSGLAANEVRLERGAIDVRLGEGRTAEVLRNLCYQVIDSEDGEARWQGIAQRVEAIFGARLDAPQYIAERGEVIMTYRTRTGVRLDLSAAGSGQQQVLLLLAFMTANPGAVLLLDEPDAHLEILRQRQVYKVLDETAEDIGSQIVAASHSEVLLNEAADRDLLIAFVGKPHRVDDRGSQAVKALKEIGFEYYLQAEEKGWVLYLEGATDLNILQQLARRLEHPAAKHLETPCVRYVANQPARVQNHFHGLREAKHDLMGVAIYDRLEKNLVKDPRLEQYQWRRRELENYLCFPRALVEFAAYEGDRIGDKLFANAWRTCMQESIKEMEQALSTLGKSAPWEEDIKASDEFLKPLFKSFYGKLGQPNLMSKTNYHRLASHIDPQDIDPEIGRVLDLIAATAEKAKPGYRG